MPLAAPVLARQANHARVGALPAHLPNYLPDCPAATARNTLLWSALDSGVRLANELHAAPALIAHSLPKAPGPQM
jgi:hypothetical protein